MTRDEVNGLLKYWQKILRLEDWDIVVVIEELSEDIFGKFNAVFKNKHAIITLQNPDSERVKDYLYFPYNLEATLVHELVHLHFAMFVEVKDESIEEILYEQAIDKLALALYNLNRGDNK